MDMMEVYLQRLKYIMPVVVLVASGILFYRAATYERMSGWFWAIVSIALSLITMLFGGIGLMIMAQVGLFIAMWVYNVQHGPRRW